MAQLMLLSARVQLIRCRFAQVPAEHTADESCNSAYPCELCTPSYDAIGPNRVFLQGCKLRCLLRHCSTCRFQVWGGIMHEWQLQEYLAASRINRITSHKSRVDRTVMLGHAVLQKRAEDSRRAGRVAS